MEVWYLLSILQNSVNECWICFHGSCYQRGQQRPVPDSRSIAHRDAHLLNSLVPHSPEPVDSGVAAIAKATLDVYLYVCQNTK